MTLFLISCASQSYQEGINDPFESANRIVFEFNKKVDTFVLEPTAKGYQKLPQTMRQGINNFFGNYDDIISFFNQLLHTLTWKFLLKHYELDPIKTKI